jgi:endonuclease/exonuclease/phosphatase (EEP) superfamily protein YafD
MDDEQPTRAEARFLWRRCWFCRLAALPFLAACLGAIVLAVVYRWPRVNWVVYYFIMRPAFVWFALLGPPLAVGILGVKFRWFLCGCLLWAICLAATEEIIPCVKPFARSRRADFFAAQSAYLEFADNANPGRQLNAVPLRIVTWNVKGGTQLKQGGIDHLFSLMPDIVLMQESDAGYLRQAIEESGLFEDYHLPGHFRGILSRFPVTKLDCGELLTGHAAAWRVHVGEGADIVCINVHLSRCDLKTQVLRGWSRQMLRDAIATTARELEELRALIELHGQEAGVIVAGDFNLPPHYPDLERTMASFKDCFAEAGYGWGKTAPTKLPAVRVDMIFVQPGVQVYYAGAEPTTFSDHYMTMAEVAVPRQDGYGEE